MRLVLDVGLFLGLGTVPLWSLVPAQSLGLVLGAGYCVGPVLGELALHGRLLRLGAGAAGSVLQL